ncbi:MAG: hypothetical protein R2822_06330 [Spirosomataceae bacterium]
MSAHHHEVVSVEEQFEFTAESKRNLLIGMGIGAALVLIGAWILSQSGGHGHEAHERQDTCMTMRHMGMNTIGQNVF